MSAVVSGIRSARLEDLGAIVPLHVAAFSTSMGVRLGPGYVRALLDFFATDPKAVFLVAAADSMDGYVLGVPVDRLPIMNRRLVRPALGGLARRPTLLAAPEIRAEARRRARLIIHGSPRYGDRPAVLPAPIFSLVALGVHPSARRRGLGAALVDAYASEVEGRGFASVRLSVYVDNTPARRLYERLGWVSFPHPENARIMHYGKRFAAQP